MFLLSVPQISLADDYDFDDDETEQGGDGDDIEFDDDDGDDGDGDSDSAPTEPTSDPLGGDGSLDFLNDTAALPSTATKKKKLTPAELKKAEEEENQRVWVSQRRVFLKTDRFEISPLFGLNINDPLITFLNVGGDINYYLNEQVGIGIRGIKTISGETSKFDEVVETYGVFPKISRPLWSASLNFQYIPIYGKFSFFNTWIFPWEFYTRAGVGWIQTFIDGHVLINGGVGQRFFMNRWVTFNLDLDYQLFQETFGPDEQVFLQNVIFGFSLSIYFPLDFEYRELR
jgi:outer membrane beta-barrel protein